jgi:hypothetical protein
MGDAAAAKTPGRDGYTYFAFTAGQYPWAGFHYW